VAVVNEDRKTGLVGAVRRLRAYQDVQNTMGRWMVAVNFRQSEQALTQFALERPDAWLEWADEGRFEGAEAITAITQEHLAASPAVGELDDYQLSTPIVEVAADLQTAKGVWWVVGIGAIPQRPSQSNLAGAPRAIWHFAMVAVDFISVEGEWKIWHLHWFRFVKTSYEQGWVDDLTMINRLNTPMHALSRPTSYHNPYTPLTIRDGIPAAPRPYGTWTDSHWMLDRDTTR
jgi:hypothetical protein